jgi:hypothetical protein
VDKVTLGQSFVSIGFDLPVIKPPMLRTYVPQPSMSAKNQKHCCQKLGHQLGLSLMTQQMAGVKKCTLLYKPWDVIE